jgi:hypothetical protein
MDVAWHARQVHQHREPRRSLHHRANRGTVQPDDEIALPVARDRPVVGFGGPLADHHLAGDVAAGLLAGASTRHAQRPAGTQARDQLALERTATLDVERLVDRLVRDPHRLIIGEIDRQSVGDLLRAPGRRPPAILTAGFVATLPRRIRAQHRRSIGRTDHAGQAVLHVAAQPFIGDQLR